MENTQITRIEWGRMEGQRPRNAGRNARLGEHGSRILLPIVRLTTADGMSGFGASRIGAEQAACLLGAFLSDLYDPKVGVLDAGRSIEFPLWDLLGNQSNQPVYALAAQIAGRTPPEALRVPCYDTSLYFDDLHLESTNEAAALLADETRQGMARGHRNFKIKVGRGARHLPLEAGTERDIAIIHAVRNMAGPEAVLLIDANNGYNLNLTKRVLAETADCNLFWLEEAFHEDPVLYSDLKTWLEARALPTLIADGEGDASPHLLNWAREGLIDVVQYDIFGHGFTRWLQTGRQIEEWNVRSAPHHYGGHVGNYVSGHLAAALSNFTFIEWDEATTPGLEAPGYIIEAGKLHIPNTPGFGLVLDEDRFREAVAANGGNLHV